MPEYDNCSREEELVSMVGHLVDRCVKLFEIVELKDEIIETQRVMIEINKAAAKEWQQRALGALDELTLSRCETKHVRESRDAWVERFNSERSARQQLEVELAPPF